MHPKQNIHENVRRLALTDKSDFAGRRSLYPMSNYNQPSRELKTQKAVQEMIGQCRFVALARVTNEDGDERTLMQPTLSAGEALATLQGFMTQWQNRGQVIGVLDLESEPEHALLEVWPMLSLTGTTAEHPA
jgi:hypothetical protein